MPVPVNMFVFVSLLYLAQYAPATVLHLCVNGHKLLGMKNNAEEFVVCKALQVVHNMRPTLSKRLSITEDILHRAVLQTSTYVESDASIVGNWGVWTECATGNAEQCGWGTRTRHRNMDDQSCHEGMPSSQEEDCFLGFCDCEDGYEFMNYSQCKPTCQQPNVDPLCDLNLDPKCVCAGETLMDLNTGECVPADQCQYCTYNNHTYSPGDRWECEECDYCTCCSGTVVQELRRCPDVRECNMTTHQLVPSADDCCTVDCIPRKCYLKTEPSPQRVVNPNGDCVSDELYDVQYCEGTCAPSTQHVDYTLGNFAEKHCACCNALVRSYSTIQLTCPNGTKVDHPLPVLESCFCDVVAC